MSVQQSNVLAGHRSVHTLAPVTATELAIILAAVVLGSTVKAVTGMGLPLIAVPVAALFVDLTDAIVVIAFPNVLANLILAAREWDSRSDTRDLPILAGCGVVGAVLGTVLLVSVSETPLLVLLVASIFGYIAIFLLNPDLRVTAQQSRVWSPVVGGVAGAFQGAIGISGPIVGSWVHAFRLERSPYIFSITTLFFLTGATQLAVLLGAGELSGRVTASLLACIPVLASIPLGTWLRGHISARGFDYAVLTLLGVSGLALVMRIAVG